MRYKLPPRRIRKLDVVYAEVGGVGRFIQSEILKGERLEDLAAVLTQACREDVPTDTLYQWVRRYQWRNEEETDVAGQDAREKTGVGAA